MLSAQAQTQIHEGPLHSFDAPRKGWLLPGDTIYTDTSKVVYTGESIRPELLQDKQKEVVAPSVLTPYLYDYGCLSATYLAPISKDQKLWLAAGGYLQNMNWGGDSYRDGALYAALGYRFNEHWEAWVYGQKSIASNYGRYYDRYGYMGYGFPGRFGMYYPMSSGIGMPGADVIGAAVKYNFNPKFSIQLNVEGVWYHNQGLQYFDQYNYPTPHY